MTVDYKVENGETKITVTNSTLYDLTHVSLLMNGQVKPIGDLKVGESGSVTKPAATLPLASGYHNYGGAIFTYGTRGTADEWSRQRELTELYFNQNNGSLRSADPMIVGYSIDHEPQYEVNGNKVKSDNMKMWVQRLDPVEQIGNRVIVPAGVISPIIVSSTLKVMNNYGNGVMQVSAGELILEYTAPNSYEVAYDKLDVQFANSYSNPNVSWSIWHEATGQWMKLDGKLGGPNEYMADGQSIRIKLTSATDAETSFPYLVLEGEEL